MDLTGIRQIGRILKPHGIRGEVKVESLSADPGIFVGLKEVILLKDDSRARITISQARQNKERWIISFKGYKTIDEVTEIVGMGLFLEEDKLQSLDDGEFFIDDLIGAEVFSLDNKNLGKIINYFETAAQGVCEVEKDNKTFMFPVTFEVLQEVLPQENKVIINLLEGLIE